MSIRISNSKILVVKPISVRLRNTNYIDAVEGFWEASTPVENDKVQVSDIAVVVSDCQMIPEGSKECQPMRVSHND